MTQYERTGHGNLTVILAFLGGAAVGAVAALLLAPRSGADTRNRIAGNASEAASRTARAAREAAVAAEAAFKRALGESERQDAAVAAALSQAKS